MNEKNIELAKEILSLTRTGYYEDQVNRISKKLEEMNIVKPLEKMEKDIEFYSSLAKFETNSSLRDSYKGIVSELKGAVIECGLKEMDSDSGSAEERYHR